MDDMQKDFSPAADSDSIDDMADDMIEMTDEEGNTTLFKILDYFFYNGELEEFVPVEDQKLEAKLMEIATLKLNDDEQADDED